MWNLLFRDFIGFIQNPVREENKDLQRTSKHIQMRSQKDIVAVSEGVVKSAH